MSVIIRLQNLPWSANALDIRHFFHGLSIPEGGVHIVGGELGDAFIAFSTDEDARQAMMLDGGKIKEIQVKLLLSSRSEMHKVIEAARQSVPLLSLAAAAPAPAPVPSPAPVPTPVQLSAQPQQILPPITPFSAALGTTLSSFGIPGLGNPQEIPQPAVIEPPAPLASPTETNTQSTEADKDDEKPERKRSKEKERRRSRSKSRSRERDRKDRKRDRRDRSRSRDRRRRDRSRSRERRDRKRDRKDRSRSRDRSPSRRSRDRRNDRKLSPTIQEKSIDISVENLVTPPPPSFANALNNVPGQQMMHSNPIMSNGPMGQNDPTQTRFNDPAIADAYNKLQELGKKRNPNAFQGDQNGGGRFQGKRGGNARGGVVRREGRPSRFENEQQRDFCVAIRNAPNHTSYGDVRRFFPFMIDKHGIKMINDHMGRRTGNIYVRFCDPRSKQLALQRKSNELKGESVIVESLDDDAYESAVDSFLPYREDNDDEDPGLIIADQENSKPSYSVLKLEDMPHFVKEHDIIKVFSDFSLLSIVLNDCRNTRTKIAYVQFVKAEDARAAYEKKDRYMFGKRQATVTAVSDEDYEKEKIGWSDKPTEKAPERVQPTETNAPRDPRQRRQQFDNGPSTQGASSIPAPAPQGGHYFGAPFVQQQQPGFPTPFVPPQFTGYPGPGAIDPRAAAANWANRPSFPNQINQVNQIQSPAPTPTAMTTEVEDEPLDCVLMKGLPRKATDRTIVKFLSDTGAVPARIHLMLDSNGMPSGDCFCEFRSTQEARHATTKHGQNLEGCRVTVDLVPRRVVEEALEGPKQQEMRDSLLGTAPQPVQQQFVPRGGFAPRGSFRGRGGFDRGGFNRGGFDQSRGSFDQGRGGFDKGRGGFDQGRGGYDQGRGGFDQSRGGYRGRGGRGGFDRGRGRGFGRGRGGGPNPSFENGREQVNPHENEQDPALEDFGAPGCVVSLENVPFRATVEDIMEFFSEFELTQDDIIRRYNERGQATGDARVAFRTPFDAQRAVKTRHMDMIYDRRISLAVL